MLALAAPASAQTFGQKLGEIMARPDYAHAVFGVAIYDLDQQRTIYGLHDAWMFAPGSTTKLLTTGTALALLGQDYRFHTPVYRTGPVRGGTLDGDLVLVASGDLDLSGRIEPGDTLAFVNYDHSYAGGDTAAAVVPGDPLAVIKELAGQVAAAGIQKVHGRVLIDTLLFSAGKDRSPIVVNDNVIDVWARPGDHEGAPLSITFSPDVGYLRIINDTKTGPAGSRRTVDQESDSIGADGVHVVRVVGSLPVANRPILYAYSVEDPARFARLALTRALEERGVPVESRDDARPSGHYDPAMRVAEHVSPPFAEEAKVTLKVSQNLHASLLHCLVGAIVGQTHGQAAFNKGFVLEHEFLEKGGLSLDGASQADGAGGAGGDLFSPNFMVRYLTYWTHRPDYAAFLKALPILGHDGTLWDIQPSSPAAGHVFAKTGTVVSTDLLNHAAVVNAKGLAGYMTTPAGRHLVFAFYINRVPFSPDIPGAGTHAVGDALGEIATAAYTLPIDDPFASVRGVIDTVMRERHIPSVVVAAAKDGKIVWEEGFGFANREKQVRATPTIMYSLASISKPITATGLMTLVERGKVDLDRPANAYLGPVKLKAFEGNAADATVRRVANHTSGLPLHWQFFYIDENRSPPPFDTTLAHYGILVTPPGVRAQYSNLGFGIIDHIIERTSGTPYATYMRHEVFDPLGLSRTAIITRPPTGDTIAERYDSAGRAIPWYDFDHRGASAVYASAHDLIRFGMFHLKDHLGDQHRVLADSTLDAMHRPTAKHAANIGYGVGWRTYFGDHGYTAIGHTGGMPGVSTMLRLYPDADAAIVVLTNGNDNSVTGRIARALAAAVLPHYVEQSSPPTPDTGWSTPAAAIVGEWSGQVHSWKGTSPARLTVRPDSTIQVRLGACGAVPLTRIAWRDGVLTGDCASAKQRVSIALRAHGDTLSGAVSAQDPDAIRETYALSSYVRLVRATH